MFDSDDAADDGAAEILASEIADEFNRIMMTNVTARHIYDRARSFHLNDVSTLQSTIVGLVNYLERRQ